MSVRRKVGSLPKASNENVVYIAKSYSSSEQLYIPRQEFIADITESLRASFEIEGYKLSAAQWSSVQDSAHFLNENYAI